MKHSAECKRVFGRYDANCPRCKELMAGARPREGWQREYYARQAQRDAQREAAVQAHFAPGGPHAQGLCGPVCTFGEW